MPDYTYLMLLEVSNKIHTQETLAVEYAKSIMFGNSTTNWKAVNKAIIKRWSLSGLKRVKQMAWRRIRNDTHS